MAGLIRKIVLRLRTPPVSSDNRINLICTLKRKQACGKI